MHQSAWGLPAGAGKPQAALAIARPIRRRPISRASQAALTEAQGVEAVAGGQVLEVGGGVAAGQPAERWVRGGEGHGLGWPIRQTALPPACRLCRSMAPPSATRLACAPVARLHHSASAGALHIEGGAHGGAGGDDGGHSCGLMGDSSDLGDARVARAAGGAARCQGEATGSYRFRFPGRPKPPLRALGGPPPPNPRLVHHPDIARPAPAQDGGRCRIPDDLHRQQGLFGLQRQAAARQLGGAPQGRRMEGRSGRGSRPGRTQQCRASTHLLCLPLLAVQAVRRAVVAAAADRDLW